MRKRRIIGVAAFALLVTGIGAAFVVCTSEPSYGGRTLSKWTSRFESQRIFDPRWRPASEDEARMAIRRLGSSATPYLVAWLAYEQPSWKSNLLYRANAVGKVAGITNRFRDGKLVQADCAVRALAEIQPLAATDLAKLGTLIVHGDRRVNHRGTLAVKNAGGLSLDALTIMMTNDSARIRKLALIDLGQRTNLHLVVNSILDRLSDESADVAMWAAMRLGDITNPPSFTVRALVNALKHPNPEVRSASACALGNLGKSASLAVPALRRVQEDADPAVRASVALALGNIDPPASENITSVPP